MGQHPPRQDTKVLAFTISVGEDGEASHDSFLDLGAIRFAELLTLGIGVDTCIVIRPDLIPIALRGPLLVGLALLVRTEALTVVLPHLDFLTGLISSLYTFTIIRTDLIPIALQGPRLVGLALLVRAEAFTVGLPNLKFLPCLGARLKRFTLGRRITGLAGGLPDLFLGPGPFLRLGYHRIDVLRTFSGLRTGSGDRGRGRDEREHHDEAREERHAFHVGFLSF